MKTKLLEHISGILFVSLILFIALYFFNYQRAHDNSLQGTRLEAFVSAPISNINDPFQRALLKDIMNIFYPGQAEQNTATVKELLRIKDDQFNRKLQNSHLQEHLTFGKLSSISGMMLKFLIIYIIVMLLTYYGVQTMAIWRFVSKRQQIYNHTRPGNKKSFSRGHFKRAALSLLNGLALFILFCPAYVIAYSIRTEFNTDSSFFMVLLALISNGLLVTYSNKFHAFLVAESRKGYVETAQVKNLHSSYAFDRPDGISISSILHPVKKFKGHVFEHIFRNARFQYFSTIKEQASFLITGLVIIEMALNIQGYLNYEMLQQILYKNYDIVIIIILGIFYIVKLTEIFTDVLLHRESLRYENR